MNLFRSSLTIYQDFIIKHQGYEKTLSALQLSALKKILRHLSSVDYVNSELDIVNLWTVILDSFDLWRIELEHFESWHIYAKKTVSLNSIYINIEKILLISTKGGIEDN